jgi:hypothetical protein
MKNDLILNKYKTERVYGTFNLMETTSFFGSKVIEIEDNILIDDSGIQYFDIISTDETNGFQNYNLDTFFENFHLLDLFTLKFDNHTIIKSQQSVIDDKYNTKWTIKIDIKNILMEYIYSKIKERRTFKTIKSNMLINKNINQSIYDYISKNILDRYKFDKMDFYVNYKQINDVTSITEDTSKKYNPIFKKDIISSDNLVKNLNLEIDNYIDPLSNLNINYSQVKSSSDYKFDYYFNIYYKKI